MGTLDEHIRRNARIVEPLDRHEVQSFCGRRIQLFQLMVGVLAQIGPSRLLITTFSSSEEYLRRLFRLRQEGWVRSAELLTDSKALKKTMNLASLAASCYDKVWVGENHSKLVFLSGTRDVVIITSQNQTSGNRLECSVVSANTAQYGELWEGVRLACGGCREIGTLLTERARPDRGAGG